MNTALTTRRAEALRFYQATGIPHRRIEDWKYTDLRAVLGDKAIEHGNVRWGLDGLPATVEVFDLKAPDSAAPDWVTKHLGMLAKNRNAMSAASFALARAGPALRVPRGITVPPVRLTLSGAGQARVLIVLEEAASLTLVETASAASGEARNLGVEFALGAKSQLAHVRLDDGGEADVLVEEVAVAAAAGASYRGHFANFGAKLSRLELNIALEGEGASARLSGVSVLDGSAHADVTTHIDHAVGRTESRQLFKLIAGGRARAVYQGRITVHPGAAGTDSNQTAKGLLLGERAEMDLKPELIILADDVKCAHGAAVGDLDVESLFYLRARGIPEAEARAVLMRAFVEDAVATIEDEAIRADIWKKVEAALGELTS
jgi:Fe-S cluster assembly protein SufD